MTENIFLLGILTMTFYMAVAKRITALINGFRMQSAVLFMYTLFLATTEKSTELYIVAGLLFLSKVIFIPYFLRRIVLRIKVNENLGLYANTAVSLFAALALTYLAALFTGQDLSAHGKAHESFLTVSIAVILIGLFLMIFRMKALAQIIGLMVMENGLFLAAAAVSGGMPFFVEIAIFFDIFVCVIILGVFIYKINKVFTHIDADKMNRLKG